MQYVRKLLGLNADGAPTGKGVRIALIDSGVCDDHPDLRDAVDRGASRIMRPEIRHSTDRHYHGTHVAGIIAGRGTQSDGLQQGIAPDATIVSLKICDGSAVATSDVLAALVAAQDLDVDIVCLALSITPDPDDEPPPWVWSEHNSIARLVRQLTDRGKLCIAAAGNSGKFGPGTIGLPGESPHVLTVGALDKRGRVFDFSSRGPRYGTGDPAESARSLNGGGVLTEDAKPDIVMPGFEIWAPWTRSSVHTRAENLPDPRCFGGWYLDELGTSQAAATVVGLAACAIEYANQAGKLEKVGTPRGLWLKRLLENAAQRIPHASVNTAGKGGLDWPRVRAAIDAL